MSEQVIITVAEDGPVKVEVKGHSGEGCLKLTEELENALGEKISDVKTRDFTQRRRAAVRANHRG